MFQRLSALPAGDRLQAALLVLWSLELYLTQLGHLKDTEDAGTQPLRQQMLRFLTSQQALVRLHTGNAALPSCYVEISEIGPTLL